jgi:hypothetical protein
MNFAPLPATGISGWKDQFILWSSLDRYFGLEGVVYSVIKSKTVGTGRLYVALLRG